MQANVNAPRKRVALPVVQVLDPLPLSTYLMCRFLRAPCSSFFLVRVFTLYGLSTVPQYAPRADAHAGAATIHGSRDARVGETLTQHMPGASPACTPQL